MDKSNLTSPGSRQPSLIPKLLISIGIIACCYWLLEAFMQFCLMPEPTMMHVFIGADIYDTLRRIVVLIVFVILGSHIQFTIQKREQAEKALWKARDEETKLQAVTMSLLTELNLKTLLAKILGVSKEILSADRGTLFMFDNKTGTLNSVIAQGMDNKKISLPSKSGIAGAVFTSGRTINAPIAEKNRDFLSDIDGKTGYKTESVLCVPVKGRDKKNKGALQFLNKKGGPFTRSDEKRLEAFSAHFSIAIENATLFEEVTNLKNYDECMLNSMSNGVISVDTELRIVRCNAASLRILNKTARQLTGTPAANIFKQWVVDTLKKVMTEKKPETALDTDLVLDNKRSIAVNFTAAPLTNAKKEIIGSLIILEDITKEKRVKSTLTRYMTKQVADKLLENEGTVLGGNIQEATVLFADIRNFTTLAERLDPKATVAMLNDYFTLMVDIVFSRQGVLDKYIGDALMAVFGAPVTTGEDPDNSVKTAIEMMIALEAFNRQLKPGLRAPISIGVGINTDKMLSGNIGSTKRMDYTVIGDGVNLASRIEKANKFYQTHILVSDFTFNRLKGNYFSRKIDLIRAKGKTKPITIYQILDHYDKKSLPVIRLMVKAYKEGIAAYEARNWKKGMDCFNRALGFLAADYPSRLYLERCSRFLENPPDDDWDGVLTMDEVSSLSMTKHG